MKHDLEYAEKKTDRRAIRTRHALREALIALIFEKGYESITVQEITDRENRNPVVRRAQ